MLDLLEPSEDEILERLASALVDDVVPPEEGFLALWTALDEWFGADTTAAIESDARLVRAHHRFGRILTAAAAAVVLVAVGIGLYGAQHGSSPFRAPARLDYATATLRSDLQNGNSTARIEEDVTLLAQAMAATAPASGERTLGASSQLLTSACSWLEISAVPSGSLPSACQMGHPSDGPDRSTPQATGNGPGGGSGYAPDRGSPDPTQQRFSGPGARTDSVGAANNAPSGNSTSNGTSPTAGDDQPSQPYGDGATSTAPQAQPGSAGGRTLWGNGGTSDTSTTESPDQVAPTSGSTTSPYSNSPHLTTPNGCSGNTCSDGKAITQGSPDSSNFQH